jgi:predicted nucleic acid-binding protein
MPQRNEYLLDACALLAFYKEEEGWEAVQDLIDQANRGEIRLCIHAVNLVEVYYDLIRVKGKAKADAIIRDVYASPIEVLDGISPDVVEEAARFKAEGGMSFADTFLVAAARCAGLTLVTCDHEELDPVDEQGLVQFNWIRPRPDPL